MTLSTDEFTKYPALASWIERLASTNMGLSLGDWMVFLGALNNALLAARAEGSASPPPPAEGVGKEEHGSSCTDLSCAQTHTLTPSPLDRLDLDALEKVALAAYPQGDWRAVPAHIEEGEAAVRHAEGWTICTASSDDGATHIATFDPPTVLRLIAAARLPEVPEAGPRPTEGAGKLVEALRELEAANECLARGRTRDTYLAMLSDGQADALLALDEARRKARELLAAAEAASAQPSKDQGQ